MSEAAGEALLDRDPREELAELVAATRALIEQYEGAGALGLPTEAPADRLLAELGAPTGGPRPVARPATAFVAPVPAAPAQRPAIPVAAAPFVAPAARPHAPLAAVASAAATAQPTAQPRPPAPPPPAAMARPPVSASAGAPLDERKTRLALLAEEARACTACGLHAQRRQAVFSRGNPFAELCFVGEGPGADEDAQGEPFVGKSGQLLDKMIAAMGYHRDDVYICNVVKCRPPENRKPEPDEVGTCMPFLAQQLALVKPKVIVALGASAMQGLIGTTEGIMRMRGKWKLYKGTTPIMPTFHPAYLLRNPPAKREVWADLQEVMRHLGRGPTARN